MAEYRLDELARVSGVSARNIRAYRERGLLDPPRRVGRVAYYEDFHLAQLETINHLLRKGFSSAHIAEFFASLRQGIDLAEYLGLQRAVLGLRSEPGDTAGTVLDLDPDSDEARALVDHALAEVAEGTVVMTDRRLGEIVARADDQRLYARAVVQIVEGSAAAIDDLADEVVTALQRWTQSHFGMGFLPKADEITDLTRMVRDYRDLANHLVPGQLDRALQHRMAAAVSDYAAEILRTRQQREP